MNKSTSGDVVLESRHLMGLFVLMVVIFGVVFVLGYELGRNQSGNSVRAADVQPGDSATEKPLPNADTLSASAPPAAQPTTDNDFYKSAVPKQPLPGTTKGARGAAPATKLVTPPITNPQPATAKTVTPAVKPPVTKAPPAVAPNKSVTPPPRTVVTPPQPASAKANTKPPVSTLPAATKSQTPGLSAPLIPKGAYLVQVAAMTKESDALAMAQALQQKKFPAFVLSPGPDRFYHVQVGPYGDQKSAEAARKALEGEGFKTLIKH